MCKENLLFKHQTELLRSQSSESAICGILEFWMLVAFLYVGCSEGLVCFISSLSGVRRWCRLVLVSDVTKGCKMVTIVFPLCLSCSALGGCGRKRQECTFLRPGPTEMPPNIYSEVTLYLDEKKSYHSCLVLIPFSPFCESHHKAWHNLAGEYLFPW